MNRLFLNNKEVDIFDTRISITKQVNDIAELRNSQNHHTNKFKLPSTDKNKQVLDFLGVLNSKSRSPYLRISATYLENGYPLIVDGYAIVTAFVNIKDYFEVTIYDGNIFLFEALSNKQLKDINFIGLTHELNTTTYVDSFSNTSGYIYALSDNGNLKETQIEINYQLPVIYVKTILDFIFSQAGFTYLGDVFQTQEFLDEVITFKRGYNSEFDTITTPVQINQTIPNTNDYIGSYESSPGTYIYEIREVIRLFNFITDPNITQNGMGFWIFTAIDSVNHLISVNLDLIINGITFTNNFSSIKIQVVKNSKNFIDDNMYYYGDVIYEETTHTLLYSGTNYNVTKNINVSLNQGDTIQVYVIISDSVLTVPQIGTIDFNGSIGLESNSGNIITVSPNNFIGDMTQVKFVKDIMQRYGLVMQKTHYKNEYVFKRCEGIISDTANAVDWSDKFSEITKTNYNIKHYAQKNRFAYNYRDVDSDKFADGFLNIENKNLPIEITHIESPYYAPEISDIKINNYEITDTPFWKEERDDTGQVLRYKPMNSKNYIARIVRNQQSINYGLSGGTVQTFTGQVPRLVFNGLDYQTIIEQNYASLRRNLNWNKLITANFLLTKQDVRNIDFHKMIYVQILSSFFYINSIKYIKDRLSKVELLKVSNIDEDITTPPIQGGCFTVTLPQDQTITLSTTQSVNMLAIVNPQATTATFTWEILTQPTGATAQIVDFIPIWAPTQPPAPSWKELTNITVAGTYIVKVTVTDGTCTDTDTIIITAV